MIFSLVLLGFIFITGLVVGSFLNVVILRTVSDESIVFPGSKCPKCQNPLKWYHNIPLLSYLFLKGKCAYCKEHISIQYPCVEFLTGCIFIVLFLRFCVPFDPLFGLDVVNPISWAQFIIYIFSLIASCLFIVIAGTDFIEMRVSDIHTYSLMGSGLLFSIVMAVMNFIFYTKEMGTPEFNLNLLLTCPVFYSVVCGIFGFILMEAIRRITSFAMGVETFGEGDAYIAGGIGFYFGALFGNFPLYSNLMPILYLMGLMFLLSAILPIFIILPIYIKKLYVNKNWFTLCLAIFFVVSIVCYYIAQKINLLGDSAVLLVSTLIIFLLGILLCREIFKGIKSNPLDTFHIPFGPSLVVSAFIISAIAPLF